MSYFDDASLVMIPSGYKDQKVYSVKPLDGSGDLTFSRASNATRVASNGLIEKVRTNFILQSEGFSTASWTKDSGASVTANTTTAPDGTTTADTLTISDSQYMYQSVTLVAGNPYTISVYVKVASGTNQFKFNTFGSSNNFTSSAYTATTTWQRFSYTFTAVGSGSTAIYPILVDGLAGGSFFIWGAQIETNDIATDYIATTSAAVSVGPVSGLPRLDYLNSTCPRLLLEPQRTNLGLWSEQFNNAGWTNAATTITANYGVSPDGYTNADRFQQTTVGALQQTISVSASTSYTVSFYCKLLGGTSASLGVYNFNANNFIFQDNLLSSLVLNQWVRVTRTFTTPVGCTSITGELWRDSTIDCLVYGFQMEQGAYATSYIPTLGTSVTRVADVCSKSGISSLIGQANGTAQMTFVMDSDTSADSTTMLGIHASTSTANRIQLLSRFGTVRLLVVANNSILTNDLLYDAAPNEVVNVAFKYGSAGVTAYVNGTQVYTTASAVVFTETMELFTIGNRSGIDDYGKGQRVSQALVFPTALSNSDLAALTA